MKNVIKITKTSIDFEKLNSGIDKYECDNRYSPYIFANKDTIDEITSIIGFSIDGIMGSKSSHLCGRYRGNKVFCDNTLQFGEVELR